MKHFARNGYVHTSTLVPRADCNDPEYLAGFRGRNWIVPHDCWSFEGVVLPGGKIIVGKSTQIPCTSSQFRHIHLIRTLGRWWRPEDELIEFVCRHKYDGDEDKRRASERQWTGPFIFWNTDYENDLEQFGKGDIARAAVPQGKK